MFVPEYQLDTHTLVEKFLAQCPKSVSHLGNTKSPSTTVIFPDRAALLVEASPLLRAAVKGSIKSTEGSSVNNVFAFAPLLIPRDSECVEILVASLQHSLSAMPMVDAITQLVVPDPLAVHGGIKGRGFGSLLQVDRVPKKVAPTPAELAQRQSDAERAEMDADMVLLGLEPKSGDTGHATRLSMVNIAPTTVTQVWIWKWCCIYSDLYVC